MQNIILIFFVLAMLAYAGSRSPNKTLLSRFSHLAGWQKLFGVLAVVVTLLILLNPELLALGLIGDTAFFDMLVLATGLQLQTVVTRVWHFVANGFTTTMRRMFRQLCYELCCLSALVSLFLSAILKATHRIYFLMVNNRAMA